eukprot:980011_1
MSSLAFLLATVFSICSHASQDGSTFISNNIHLVLHDAVPCLKEHYAIDSTHNAPAEAMDLTHLKGELNQINDTLSFPNTCASDECEIPSNEGMIRPIDLNTFESNRIQSSPFHESTHNPCPRQELTKHGFMWMTATNQIETHAPHAAGNNINPNALLNGDNIVYTRNSICSGSSQDERTFISNNVLHDAAPDGKEYSAIDSTRNAPPEAMESTHLRGESNQTNETLSFPNTYTSNEGTIRPTANAIVLNTFECNRIQSTAFHESTLNRCCRQELTKHAFVSITAIKKTNQGMMAMQRKVSGTCHVDQGRIKVRKERSQIFIATVSPPSATIITPSSIKPASVRSTPIKKETARRYSRQTSFLSELPSATCTPSLCLNCSVKFSAELKFFSNELKTHFSDEVVNGTDFTTKARHIAGNYTQNKDAVSFITNRLLVHAAEYESRLASIGVVVEGEWIDTMRNNSIGRKISSDSRTVSLSPITFIDSLQKDADAFNIAPPYRCYQGNGVHSSSLPPECAGTDGIMTRAIDEGEGTAQDEPDVDPLPQSVSNTHTKRKKHVEFRLNEGITPVSALFTKPCIEGKPSLFGIIALSCAT